MCPGLSSRGHPARTENPTCRLCQQVRWGLGTTTFHPVELHSHVWLGNPKFMVTQGALMGAIRAWLGDCNMLKGNHEQFVPTSSTYTWTKDKLSTKCFYSLFFCLWASHPSFSSCGKRSDSSTCILISELLKQKRGLPSLERWEILMSDKQSQAKQ